MEIAKLGKMCERFGDILTSSEDEIEVDFIGGKKEHIALIFGIGLMKNWSPLTHWSARGKCTVSKHHNFKGDFTIQLAT